MAPGPPGATWSTGKRRAALTLGAAAGLVLIVYAAGFRIDGAAGGFWSFALSYARAPIEAWGNFGYYSPHGVSLLAASQIRMILPVRDGAALLGGVVMSAALVILAVWHIGRIRGKARHLQLRLFGLVFLSVYLLFFLWWMPSDTDFFLATLLPLWLLCLILVSDMPPGIRSLPVAAAAVLILAFGNIIFTILPMHDDAGPGRALALALDGASPAAVEMVAGYSVQQEMLYFTDRTRVHEGDGLFRAVQNGDTPWGSGATVVIEGPYLRGLLNRDDVASGEFLRWLMGFDPEEGSCLVVRALPLADGLILGPERGSIPSWSGLVDEIRELSKP